MQRLAIISVWNYSGERTIAETWPLAGFPEVWLIILPSFAAKIRFVTVNREVCQYLIRNRYLKTFDYLVALKFQTKNNDKKEVESNMTCRCEGTTKQKLTQEMETETQQQQQRRWDEWQKTEIEEPARETWRDSCSYSCEGKVNCFTYKDETERKVFALGPWNV